MMDSVEQNKIEEQAELRGVWKGTIVSWRLDHLQYSDGPYTIVFAHPISAKEYNKLLGNVG